MGLHFQETGPASAPSIVLIHGAGVAGWYWHLQVKDLAVDYHCIVPDLPGHGQSPEAYPFSLADAAVLVADLIRTQAHNGRAHVIGHSLGGAITAELLAHHAELVDHAILNGPAGGPLPRFMTHWMHRLLPLARTKFMLRQNAKILRVPDHLYDTYRQSQLRLTGDMLRSVMREVDRYRVPAILSDVEVPLLAVVGEKEPKIMHETARRAVSIMPNAAGRIAPKGLHGWNLYDPELFNNMVRAWITDQPLPDRLWPLN